MINMSKQKKLKIEKNMICSVFKPPSNKDDARKQRNSVALPPLLLKTMDHIKISDPIRVPR